MTHPIPSKSIPKPNFISKCIEKGEYYFLDLDAGEREELTLACGGLEECSLDYKVSRKEFRFHGIEYIVTGKCKLTLDGQEYILTSGSLFYYDPGSTHKIENIGDASLVKYFVDFSGLEAEELIKDSILGSTNTLNLGREDWVAQAFQNLQDCGTSTDEDGQEICTHLLRYLISRLKSCGVNEGQPQTHAHSVFESSKSYIESNFLNINSAHEVADICNISHQYLCRLFKRYSDETPSQMLLRLKITRSAALLEQGRFLVKEIAEFVGFEDQYYFSKRFKDYFGTSPRNYLALARQELTA